MFILQINNLVSLLFRGSADVRLAGDLPPHGFTEGGLRDGDESGISVDCYRTNVSHLKLLLFPNHQ